MVTVVILGAGYAGIGVAHGLLKYTRPKVPDLKVVLVAPSTHHFWNMAAVRGIIPGEVKDGEIFTSIAPGFAFFPPDTFQFIVGTADSVDAAASTVQVKTAEGFEAVGYTHLVVATGSSYPSRVPFTTNGSFDEMTASWHDMQDRVDKSRSIVIAGGGPTGVETAGELGARYGTSKSISIVIPGDNPLSDLQSSVQRTVAQELQALGVRLVRSARVVVAAQDAGADGSGQTAVELSNGEKLHADLYLPLYGMQPNTGFLPAALLDGRGSLKLEPNLQVSGVANMWGVGDAGNLEGKQAIYAERQALHLTKNLHAVLTGAESGVKPLGSTVSPQVFVTLGRSKGSGQYSRFKLPSLVVTSTKGKSFFMEKASGLVSGKNIVRSSI